MACSMDIDTSLMPAAEDFKISIHPLAIVNMSDQYTRISLGGSALATTAPVVGLLFGKLQEKDDAKNLYYHLQVKDADDIPTDDSETAKTQVSLHQAVYPDLAVVGWYRVVSSTDDSEPTVQDLQLTQQLQQLYQVPHFVYCVLEAAANDLDKKQKAKTKDAFGVSSDADDDDDLPFNLYQLSENVLKACEHWNLDTAAAERIAVERVMREKPQQQQSQQTSTSTLRPTENRFEHHASELAHSLRAIQERVAVLEGFLLKVQQQQQEGWQTPPPFSLLRKVQSVLLQMGPLARPSGTNGSQSADSSAATTALTLPCSLEHLAALCHTVDACQLYVDKFRVVQEATAAVATQRSSSSKNDMMRGRRGFM